VKYLFGIWLLVTLASGQACAQKSHRLVLKADTETVSSKQLMKWGHLKLFYLDSAVATEGLRLLAVSLCEKGFAEASIDRFEWKTDTALAEIHVGRQYHFTEIRNGNVPEEVLRRIGYRERQFNGKSMMGSRLGRLKQRIIGHYENRGYPFAEVRLDSLTLVDGNLTTTLQLEQNQLFEIDSVIIKGTARIQPKYLQNYLGIKPKDRYNESRISEISTRVKEIAFVNEIKPPEVQFGNGKANVFIYLDKKRASQFDGILGVLPSSEKPGQVLVTGELSIKLLSAFRRGEIIDLSWRKMQARTQNLNVHVTYPFLFNTGFGIDGTFELYKRDTVYLNLRGVAGVQYHLIGNDYIKVFADIRSTNVLAASTLVSSSTLNPDNVDSQTQLYGFGYMMQRLDYRLNPRKGFDLYAEASAGSKKIVPDATIDESRYEGLKLRSFQLNAVLKASYFIPIPNRSTIKLAANGGYMRSQNLFESEAFRIGGLKTLRGFDEESIYATLFGIGTIEYRFLLDQNSYLFAFFDGAYYENRATNKRVTDRPFGFGLGISFFTKIGVFSLNYALGKQFQNPIDFRAGKIHFGVVSYF